MADLEIGGELSGYRIDEVLGRGGMGVVYGATDERLGRKVAVKVVAPAQAADPGFRRRFIEESRAAAAIDHPNVLPVYEAGEEDGVLFLVARLVNGADLAELIKQSGAMDLARALKLVGQVGAALDEAHSLGLVHRDVKPANVLVVRDSGRGAEHCYLTDFGLAQRSDRTSRLTVTGQFVGTLDYIAPEQIQGVKVDGRADVYALASMFFELATGSPPFDKNSEAALLFAHLSDPPPKITDRLEGAPGALDDVIAKGMAKAPEDRYASCTDFVSAAREALGESVPGLAAPVDPNATRVAAGRTPKTKPAAPPVKPPAAPPGPSAAVEVPPAGDERGRPAPRRRWGLIVAGIAALLLVAGGVAWAVSGSGGGGSDPGGGTADGVQLSSDTTALANEVSFDTERMAESVSAGGPTGDLAGGFRKYGDEAASLAGRAGTDLKEGEAGQEDLQSSAESLEESSDSLAAYAGAPKAAAASRQASSARSSMADALTSLDRALKDLQKAAAADGATELAAQLGESLKQQRDHRDEILARFNALVRGA